MCGCDNQKYLPLPVSQPLLTFGDLGSASGAGLSAPVKNNIINEKSGTNFFWVLVIALVVLFCKGK